jgi:NADH:ubiquinone oxidoreductase subunit 6 (subunit J)
MILSGWEAVFFWIFAIAAIFAGLLTVMARNTVHCALFLISTLVSVAALFILQGAEFIAGVQILVYVGGVMVLFLFVIMLVNVGAEERGDPMIFNKPKQVAASLIFCLLLVVGLLVAIQRGVDGLKSQNKSENVAEERANIEGRLDNAATGTTKITKDTQQIGGILYRYASLPFEVASILLLVAIIGSVMLARTIKQEAAVDDVAPEVLREEIQREPELAEIAVIEETGS